MPTDTKLEFELHAYVDGDLDEEAMERVEAYLRKNPEAAAKVRDYLRQNEDMRGMARAEASSERPAALTRLGQRLARRLRPGRFFGPPHALVMSLLFVAGWLGHMAYVPLIEGPAFANEVVQAHLMTSSDPSEMLPLSPERVSKLYSQIGEIERLPDLSQFGFTPVGAQLLPSDEGIVLHVPYRNDDGLTVSYFLLHDREEAEVPQHVLHRQGVTMVYWQHDHSRYALTAPMADSEMESIASYVDANLAGSPGAALLPD